MKNLILVFFIIGLATLAKSQYNSEIKIETMLKTDTTSIGQKIHYPNLGNEEVTVLKVTIPPGKSTGWHKHEIPVFAYVLKGNLTLELENNKTTNYAENSSFSEVVNTLHNGINNGNEDVVLIAFFIGVKGKALSVH